MAKGPDNRASAWADNEEEVEVSDWSGSTIAIMKEELRSRDLPVSGSHADLAERLEGSDAYRGELKEAVDRAVVDRASDVVSDAMADPSASVEEALDRFSEMLRPLIDRIVTFVDLASSEEGGAPRGVSPVQPAVDVLGNRATTVVEQTAIDRERVRDAARDLLAQQPDGRSRALAVLAEYGGSVSAVPEGDLARCLSALDQAIGEAA